MARRIDHFLKQKRSKTASNYSCALKHFMQFRKGEDIPAGELTSGIMREFQIYLVRKGLKMNTVSLYNRTLKATYNYALDEEIIQEDKRPFRKNFTGQEKTRKRTLEEKTVRKLIKLDLAGNRALEFARDMFLFSVYMQGMPFVDIAHLTKAQVRGGQITYQRRKTNGRLTVAVHPRAQAIIDKWRVDVPGCPYLFPILYDPQRRKDVKYGSALRIHNRRLAKISILLGLEHSLSSRECRRAGGGRGKRVGKLRFDYLQLAAWQPWRGLDGKDWGRASGVFGLRWERVPFFADKWGLEECGNHFPDSGSDFVKC